MLAALRVSSGTVMPVEASPRQEKTLQPAATNALRREARTFGSVGGYNYNRPYGRPYEQPNTRCISCLYQAMGGGPSPGPGYLDRDR